jgi:hypothetical protein
VGPNQSIEWGQIRVSKSKIDKELQARVADSLPDPDKAYLRPYESARQLLADLVAKMDKRSTRRKPEPKSPPKVYIKALA